MLHLFGCLYCYISDARSYKHKISLRPFILPSIAVSNPGFRLRIIFWIHLLLMIFNFLLHIMNSRVICLMNCCLTWSFKWSFTATSLQTNWAGLIEVTNRPIRERIFIFCPAQLHKFRQEWIFTDLKLYGHCLKM